MLGSLLFLLTLAFMIYEGLQFKQYQKSQYFKQTRTPFWFMKKDYQAKRIYAISKVVEKLSGRKYLYFHYQLDSNKEKTSEIDLLFLHQSGIVIINFKAFRGWILGSEFQKDWLHFLPNVWAPAKIENFYNPIFHKNHCYSHLQHLLQLEKKNLSLSYYMVFENRCQLKTVSLNSSSLNLLKLRHLKAVISKDIQNQPFQISSEQLKSYHEKLLLLAQNGENRERQTISYLVSTANKAGKKKEQNSVKKEANITSLFPLQQTGHFTSPFQPHQVRFMADDNSYPTNLSCHYHSDKLFLPPQKSASLTTNIIPIKASDTNKRRIKLKEAQHHKSYYQSKIIHLKQKQQETTST